MASFLKEGQPAGLYTVTSVEGDTAKLRLKTGIGEELVVRPATERDLEGIFALVRSVQITGREVGDRIAGRRGLGRSIGEGGLFSDYTGRKGETLDEFRMLLGTPYLLVAVKKDAMVGFVAGFPADKAADRKEAVGYEDWKSHVIWHVKPSDTRSYVLADPLVVAKGFSGKGVGEPLMRALLQSCARTGVEELHGEVVSEPVENLAPLKLLERLGFEETGSTTMKLKPYGTDNLMAFGARVFTRRIK